eukprot:CAMPEP_0113672062 /NCGR_PEP_ID=MMETSP0038_2-20120614/6050_1 /TAXON_ID=2898 /ORGANISM="Cryptomonas paramecium" /LENGTH=105 /DNA_ID=CAMNT_0000588281 /DNA_START=401 /DNA_END=717 /DNA_ORIENTATION=+ /assembly_acc=CAM_ASM_000170
MGGRLTRYAASGAPGLALSARRARAARTLGVAEGLDDEHKHVDVVAAREERAAREQLGQDAAHGPHVDGRRVVLVAQQQLRRAVPPRDDVAGLVRRVGLRQAGEA